VTGGWRKLHNEELHNFSASIIITIMSRRMRLAGHIARGKEMHIGLRWESQKERDNFEDVGGRIILR
jgi:hypothetical protein